MTAPAQVARLWRHPIKSIGTERIARVALAPGATIPFDRTWALAHEKTRAPLDPPAWAPCSVWIRCTVVPGLAAVSARMDEETGTLTLTHPERPPLAFDPDAPADAPRFLDWIDPLIPARMPRPRGLVRVPGRGMTDTDFPSVSIASLASLRALSERMGQPLDPRRFRANIWLEGLAPWAEFDWEGRELILGGARLRVVERIGRCNATKANPETGRRDAETLAALETHYGHKDFGVYAEVIAGGPVAEGDPAMLD